jgi:cysteinyl-tRNA synthetase
MWHGLKTATALHRPPGRRAATDTGKDMHVRRLAVCLALAGLAIAGLLLPARAARPTAGPPQAMPGPQPPPPTRLAPPRLERVSPEAAEAERLKRINSARSWGYQLSGATIDTLAASPYDLLVVDATTGLASGRTMTADDVRRLKHRPDGGRRLVIGYLSIGEAEDYRPDYFTKEYLEEEAPDWLMHENPDWRGNRLVNICAEGWITTMLGDARGRSVYDSIRASPLYRLVELGLDGVYLDRVDVYEDTKAKCPDGEARMVDFVVRLAAHARRADPYFLVVQQNAEDLLKHARLVKAIDGVGKESLFYGWGGGDGSNRSRVNSADSVKWSIDRLNRAKAAGRAIFVIDYASGRAQSDTALKRNRKLGYVPYIGPKALDRLWLPGKNF